MFPVFRLTRQASFDPALLADDFQKWIIAFKENTIRCQEKVKTAPKPELQSIISARALWLAQNSVPLPSTNHSPTSSSSSTLLNYYSNEFFGVQTSSKGGLGVFAITDIPIGTVVISESPLFRATLAEQVEWEYKKLSKEQKSEYDSLAYWEKVDKYKVQGIFKTNRFETQGGESKYGIFLNSSRFNHACHPYATCTYHWHQDQKKLVFTTLRDIGVGEEMTISYTGGKSDRAAILPENYGFWCDCPGCPPAKASEAYAKMRAETTGCAPKRSCRISGGVLYYSGGCTILEDSWKEN